jgi:hypothetical protein
MTNDTYSTYVDGNKRADVIKREGSWGCVFYTDNEIIATEMYPSKSEELAESAAENYVMGIKTI